MSEIKEKFFLSVEKVHHVALLANLIKWTAIASIVGIVVGSLSALFLESLNLVTNTRLNHPWLLFLLPLAGAFVSFLYSKYGKTSSQGNNLILDQIHGGDNGIPLRMAPLVFIGTIITHLFGGSAGREGTAVQIGGSIAEYIGKILKLDKTDRRIILMCGISSGFGSVFGTPLAGTIFGMEVIAIGTMEYSALIPCFIASFVGNLVTTVLGAKHSHYALSGIPELSTMVLLKVIIASLLFGLVSILFSEGIHSCKKIFSKLFKNPMIKSIIGGVIIILLTLLIGTREYLGLGLPYISASFNEGVPKLAFLGKIIFTSITLGTGFQGGEVTPFFFVGSTFGNALGGILDLSPIFLAGLGLVAVFCGATNTPIASFFLGLELFHGEAVIYLFIACIISYLFSGYHGIYTSQKIGNAKTKLLRLPNNTTIGSIKEYRKR
ncbi:voltage-gated chloride channel family protein [Clostridium cellulovorans]|uniref:Cl-channel voltage-gated family protein n=1 Tax=Clostridium cellulovorans (strain ATCC 35296 / DSM 3052 / OCM 3 / 743B) TaxID=573061 RepID=D9SPP5_CLOC7|nr:voltage-gated chloride channel family protein [Clostridium cellulovorans]ADL50094.1 Cl- channel voltage-gated family protein [Clostridium cellulovorans 743B]